MNVEIVIPQIGESITSVFVAGWLKNPGDTVVAGEPVLSIDSDKASMEIPAPASGVLAAQTAAEGDEVPIGGSVGSISTEGAQVAPRAQTPVAAGPAARQEAQLQGVALADLTGSGPGGRVMRGDVSAAAAKPAAKPAALPVALPATAPAAKPAAKPVAVAPAAPVTSFPPDTDGVERIAMSPLRRTIARRLVESQQSTATLTTFNEVDLSRVMELRKTWQDTFVKKYGIKLGFMSFFAKATIEALKAFPAVNAEIDGNDVLYKSFYHLGVAVSGPKGLVVPVIRDTDRMSFAELEMAIAERAERARENKLTLGDFKDGTFTISNGGVFGSLMSTPILNPPQVGILGMHGVQDRPVAVNGQVVIRPMMYIALSYDHRIVDGRESVSFLKKIKEAVEAPERILLEV